MAAAAAGASRIAAIDWMRGFVMVLMAVDHASMMLNAGRVSSDTAATWVAGTALPPDQFFTRWITRLCAPTFVFLAGTAIAVSASRRRARGMSAWSIDKDLLIRGAFIALLDLTLMSALAGRTLLQVLYAIGVGMMLMVPLRRLGTGALFGLSVALIVFGEAITGLFWDPSGASEAPLILHLAFAPRFSPDLVLVYPAIPWLAIMMLGWAFGERFVAAPREGDWPAERVLLVSGLAALALFALVRGLDGYGNMFLHRDDGSLVQWLHVSKYPPGLAYIALELGLVAVILAGLIRLEPRLGVRDRGPILVLGQTALFFYVCHFLLLGGAGRLMDKGGLEMAYLGAAVVLVVLYPVCLGFRALKRRYPRSVLRFV